MNPVISAILIGLPSTILGVLVYLQSKKVDAVAEQSGIVTQSRAGTEQIIEGLNKLVNNLQADNKALREDVVYLNLRIDRLATEMQLTKKEIAWLRKKYDVPNDDESTEVA